MGPGGPGMGAGMGPGMGAGTGAGMGPGGPGMGGTSTVVKKTVVIHNQNS